MSKSRFFAYVTRMVFGCRMMRALRARQERTEREVRQLYGNGHIYGHSNGVFSAPQGNGHSNAPRIRSTPPPSF